VWFSSVRSAATPCQVDTSLGSLAGASQIGDVHPARAVLAVLVVVAAVDHAATLGGEAVDRSVEARWLHLGTGVRRQIVNSHDDEPSTIDDPVRVHEIAGGVGGELGVVGAIARSDREGREQIGWLCLEVEPLELEGGEAMRAVRRGPEREQGEIARVRAPIPLSRQQPCRALPEQSEVQFGNGGAPQLSLGVRHQAYSVRGQVHGPHRRPRVGQGVGGRRSDVVEQPTTLSVAHAGDQDRTRSRPRPECIRVRAWAEEVEMVWA